MAALYSHPIVLLHVLYGLIHQQKWVRPPSEQPAVYNSSERQEKRDAISF